ncbi:ABC transporter permease [uncultured Tessaracoccus sp.]|uniref:ABC transporter permease n=1 Tax=uncultured Tessaracoccus sp. TaxID=905023 RepID=UPI0025FE9834|nr:ABC transporter permease [uncultured Tessaracoccus sp.]
MSTLQRLWRERRVLALLVRRDLRVRYSRSVIGYLWTVLDPLANALIYFMIFVVIFERGDAGHHPYFLFLLAGLLPWQWFNAGVNESMRALLAERQLVRSMDLPREIWVVRVVLSKGIEYVLSLPVLVLFTAIYIATGDTRLDWQLVFFPLAMLLEALLITAFGLTLAPLTVMMYDFQPTVRIFLRVYFYMTPIIFNLELLDKLKQFSWLQILFQVNPLTGALELYRAGFFPADPRWHVVGYSCIGIALLFGLGVWTFKRMEPAVLKEI